MSTAAPSVDTPNTRLRRITNILRRPPSRAARLAVVSKTAQGSRVAEWEAAQLRDFELAAIEVESAIVDHAEELGYVVVEFSLVWEAEDGRPITSPNISWRKPAGDNEVMDHQAFDGSDRADNVQRQRFAEAQMRMTLQTQMRQMSQSFEHNDALHERLLQAYGLIDSLREELAEVKEQLILARNQAEPVAPSEPSPVQQQFLQLAAQYLPVLVAQAMQPAKPPTVAQGAPGHSEEG